MDERVRNNLVKYIISLVLIIIVCFIVIPTSSIDAAEIIYEPRFNQSEARSMLEMINEFRHSSDAWYWNEDDTAKITCTDLQDLVYDYDLEKVAMQRAAEIAISWGHTRPDGSSTWSAYEDYGYNYQITAGENIAAGQSSANAAFVAWREDNEDYSGQGHRRNMLKSNVKAIGIACVTVNGTKYWVQEFAGNTPVNSTSEAVDSSQPMKIKVTDSNVSLISVQNEALSIDVGSNLPIPDVQAKVQFSGSWPSGKSYSIIIPGIFNTADGEFVSVNEEAIYGLKAGTGYISGMLFGEKVSLNVLVNDTYVEDPEPDMPKDVFYGDLNADGVVNAKDVTLLRRYLASGWGVEISEKLADVNADGVVNAKDVTLLRRYLAGGWGVILPEKITPISKDDQAIEKNTVTYIPYNVEYINNFTVMITNGDDTYYYSTDGKHVFYSLMDTRSFNIVFDDTGRIYINEHNGSFNVATVTCELSEEEYYFRFFDTFGNKIQEEHSHGCGGTTPYGCKLYNLSENRLVASCFRGIPEYEAQLSFKKIEKSSVTPVHYSVTQITNDIVQISSGENRYYFAADKSRVFYSLMDISTFNLVFDDTGKIYINEHNGSFVVDRVSCEVSDDGYYFGFYDKNGNWIQEEHSHGCGGTTPNGCKLYNLSTGKLMASCYRGGLQEDVLVYADDTVNEETVSHSRYYLTSSTSDTVKLSNGATTYCFATDGTKGFYSLTDTASFNIVFDDTGKIYINEHNGSFVVESVTCELTDENYYFRFYDKLGNKIQEEHSNGCGGTTPYGCILYNLSEGRLMASCFRGIPHIEEYEIEKTEISEDGTVITYIYYSKLSTKRERMLKSENRVYSDGSEYYCDYYKNGSRMKETHIYSDGKKEEKYYRENDIIESQLITFSFGSTQYWTYNEDGQSVKAVGRDPKGNEEWTYNYTYFPKAEGQLLAQVASDIHLHTDGGEWGVIYYQNGCWQREWWKKSTEEGEKIHWENGALKSEYHKYNDGSTEETTYDEAGNELTWVSKDPDGNIVDSRGI